MQSAFRIRVFCIQLVLLSLAVGTLLAVAQDVQMVPDQQDREAADKAQSQKGKDSDDQPVTTFKANTNIVQLFFNVKDKKGGMIGNLPKDAFEVSEDGKPQTIKYFSAESQLPLTLGILIRGMPHFVSPQGRVAGRPLLPPLCCETQIRLVPIPCKVGLWQAPAATRAARSAHREGARTRAGRNRR